MKMKKPPVIILLICLSVGLLSFSINDNPKDINNEVIATINSGNASQLAKYFNLTIELTIPDHEGTFSNTQAELLVKNFFSKYPPKSFSVNNQGTSKGGSSYTIGTLVTANGSFRTYYLIKSISGTNYIQQLQFEKLKH